MKLFNRFFVSYEVVQGPKIILLEKVQLGKIIFYPSKKNIFVLQEANVFVFDNNLISFDYQITDFLNYTAEPQENFTTLCRSIWEEECGLIP